MMLKKGTTGLKFTTASAFILLIMIFFLATFSPYLSDDGIGVDGGSLNNTLPDFAANETSFDEFQSSTSTFGKIKDFLTLQIFGIPTEFAFILYLILLAMILGLAAFLRGGT